jgi:hypothetical protein
VSSAHSLRFLFFCLLCSLCHVPSMHHSPSVHFCCCALPPSSHLNHTQPQQHRSLLCSMHSYSLCAPCACNMHQAPACSPPPTILHNGVFTRTSLCHPPSLQPPTHLSILLLSSCRVLYLIIIATLQLLWRFHPRVQHHWVLY